MSDRHPAYEHCPSAGEIAEWFLAEKRHESNVGGDACSLFSPSEFMPGGCAECGDGPCRDKSRTTPSLRDQVAAEIHKPCEQRWDAMTGILTLHGIEAHYPAADAALKVFGECLRTLPVEDGWIEAQVVWNLADALTKEGDDG